MYGLMEILRDKKGQADYQDILSDKRSRHSTSGALRDAMRTYAELGYITMEDSQGKRISARRFSQAYPHMVPRKDKIKLIWTREGAALAAALPDPLVEVSGNTTDKLRIAYGHKWSGSGAIFPVLAELSDGVERKHENIVFTGEDGEHQLDNRANGRNGNCSPHRASL